MFEALHFWHWWVLAAVLIILELTVAGTYFFLWLAVAAGVTGGVALLAPGLTWELQVLIWVPLSVASVFAWRHFKPNLNKPTDQPALNRRDTQVEATAVEGTSLIMQPVGTPDAA